jgi:hypothetical protein
MIGALERTSYILIILFTIMYTSFPWRSVSPRDVRFAATSKIQELTERYGDIQIAIDRIDDKSNREFLVAGIGRGTKSTFGADGFRENVTTVIRYEVNLDFWCTTLPEQCTNYRSVKLVGENQRVPAL